MVDCKKKSTTKTAAPYVSNSESMANVRSELPIDTVIQTGKTEDPLCQPKTRSVKVGVINKSIVWFCEISQILRNTPRVLGPDDYVNASCAAGTTLRFLFFVTHCGCTQKVVCCTSHLGSAGKPVVLFLNFSRTIITI